MPVGETQAPTPQGGGGANFMNSIMSSNPVGAAAGAVLGLFNDRRQLRQQERLQNLQMQGQRAMGVFNYNQQMKMWENTNYPAQVEQMKKSRAKPSYDIWYGRKRRSNNKRTTRQRNRSTSTKRRQRSTRHDRYGNAKEPIRGTKESIRNTSR